MTDEDRYKKLELAIKLEGGTSVCFLTQRYPIKVLQLLL